MPSRTKRPVRGNTDPATDDPSSPSHSQPQSRSQSQSQSQASQLDCSKLIHNVRAQKEQIKKQRLQHDQASEQLRKDRLAQIHQRTEAHKLQQQQEIRDIRRPHLDRLRRLLDQKSKLETSLDACRASRDTACVALLRQLHVAVADRMDELSGLDAQLAHRA